MRKYQIIISSRRVPRNHADPCHGCVAKYNHALCKDIQESETCDAEHIFEIAHFDKTKG